MTTPQLETWTEVCPADRIAPGTGVTALVDGRQLAVLRADDGELHAIDGRDPFTGANVLARGLVGERDGWATVASPLRKQRFVLATGRCLDDDAVAVTVHDVRVRNGRVQVRLTVCGSTPIPAARPA